MRIVALLFRKCRNDPERGRVEERPKTKEFVR